MKKLTACILVLGLIAPACATAQRPRFQEQPKAAASESMQSARERELLAEFARQLPAGARVRVSDTNKRVIRGTLIKATDTAVVIQPRGRVPEPIVEVPFTNLATLEQEQPSGGGASVGRAVAIGAGAGAAAALGVILILIAAFGD
jgi:hypothetical protein